MKSHKFTSIIKKHNPRLIYDIIYQSPNQTASLAYILNTNPKLIQRKVNDSLSELFSQGFILKTSSNDYTIA